MCSNRFFNALIATAGIVVLAHGQEKIEISPTPSNAKSTSQEQASREWDQRVAKTRADAVSALKSMQKPDGAWTSQANPQNDDISAQAIEALLDNGVPPTDSVVVKGLKNLRGHRPEFTNAVALQTVALCKANDRRNKQIIERNVEWLLKAVRSDGNRLLGWGQIQDSATRPFDACSFNAVMALREAKQVGIHINERISREIRSSFVARQKKDGGWTWLPQPDATSAREPTAVALYVLEVANEQLSWSWQTERAAVAIKNGTLWLAESGSPSNLESVFFLYLNSRLAKLSGNWVVNFKDRKRDWFEEGSICVVNNQTDSGSIFVPNSPTARTTASALLFLAARK